MPRHTLGATPFPLKVVDKDGLITDADILHALAGDGRATICLRYTSGPPKRGGYFFHVRKDANDDTFQLYDFEETIVANISLSQLCNFINHCSGRLFDPESFALCQSVVNLRQDPGDQDQLP